MKCLVTAGPTYEPLDEVRRLTNFSTGRLGTELAEFLDRQGHEVILLRGYYSTWPEPRAGFRRLTFTTTDSLRRLLCDLAALTAGAVFHAAAVNDFSFGRVWERSAGGQLVELQAAKLGTRAGTLLAELVPAPKLITELRGWFPKAFLAGWKYELDGTQPEAIAKAAQQITACRTNACVVNGKAYGEGFGLLAPDGQCIHCQDRPALYAELSKRAAAVLS